MLTVCFLLLAQAIVVVIMLQQEATAWGLAFIPLFVLLVVAAMWGVRWLLWRRLLPGKLFAGLWLVTTGLLGAAAISATVEIGHAISGGIGAFDWEAPVTLLLVTFGLWSIYLFWRTCVKPTEAAALEDASADYGRAPVPTGSATNTGGRADLGLDDDDELLADQV